MSELLREGAKIQDIAHHLDLLDPESRVREMVSLPAGDQARLYEISADSPAITRSDLVPDGTAPRQPVIHDGINSQPLFRRFQKRVCLPEDGSPRVFGYNEAAVGRLIGPGFFVAHDTEPGDERGAVVVDYYLVPDGPVAAGWPPVVPNSKGLQRFVYDKTRDYMRRVSEHVSIGKAVRLEKRTMGYFLLCRRD
ncbi:MAG: hypothetical protein ACQGVK_01085 [Myxococcota bacterium]